MTLTSETVRAQYSGDDSTTSFAVPFIFWTTDDLQVVLTDSSGVETTWVRGTQYTVTGGAGSTGTVEVETAPTDYTPATGETLTIKSNLTKTQDTDIPLGGSLDTQALEQQLDKIVRMAQERTEQFSRTLIFPVSDASSISSELPASADRASKFLGFSATGEPIASSGPVDTVAVSTFMETVLDDTDAPTGRATLGIDGASGNIATGDIADSAVTTAKINDNAVTSDKVDASVWSTGDVKLTLKASADTGWVLMDDGTIGNASSGGTTRANADTEDLFTLLWTNISDTYAPVSGGRGASAAADFAADKTITLPAVLGRALAVAGAGSGLTSRALGETDGAETRTLVEGNLPSSITNYVGQSTSTAFTGGGAGAQVALITPTQALGSDTAFGIVQPSSFLNVMIKL